MYYENQNIQDEYSILIFQKAKAVSFRLNSDYLGKQHERSRGKYFHGSFHISSHGQLRGEGYIVEEGNILFIQ